MKSILLIVLVASPLPALDVSKVVPVGEFATVTHDAGSFIDISPDRNERQRIDVSNTVTVFTGAAGKYAILEVIPPAGENGKWIKNVATVTIGAIGPEPPPAPTPGPGPDPVVPPPTVPGKRNVVILHESEADTPQFNQLKIGLRTGDAAAYLKSSGHNLLILDEEATDQLGRPLDIVKELTATGVSSPSLFVLNEEGAILFKGRLNPDASAAGVLAIIKDHD